MKRNCTCLENVDYMILFLVNFFAKLEGFRENRWKLNTSRACELQP